ncbi:MAG: 1-acyl-sn-glycerol-3-phosphate acyltransferase [Treponema sp.]|nr:1-acyl-sn-glycerol-3-phosphate acyltransferase [Treponema sp.]
MEGIPLREKYGKYFGMMSSISKAAANIDATNVYEPANPDARKIMNIMLDENILPQSHLANIENFKAFYDAITHGAHGLILMEHFSNLDLPALIYQLERCGEPWGPDLASRIVAIAGMKLNEENPMVRAWAEGFSRVVIYPSRSLHKVESDSTLTEEQIKEEEKRSRSINLAAMRAMEKCKRNGQAILVFPAGTRYRPGKPETRRGLREIDSYLRLFDTLLLVSINGNCLRLNPDNTEDMLADLATPDVIIQAGSALINTKEFRNNILSNLPPDTEDPKQVVVDKVMELLEKQHDQFEPEYQRLIAAL